MRGSTDFQYAPVIYNIVNHKTVTSKIYKTIDVIPSEEQFRHENYMPAIIDRETFDQAQVLLESRLRAGVRAKGGNVIHRYCGMIKCAECGASLIAKKRTVAGHSWVEYTCNSSMIEKRESEIAELAQKIEDCKRFDELSKKRRDELMSTAEMLDEVLLEPYITDANMRLLVRKIIVHENEDGSLDLNLEFNGDFNDTSKVCFSECFPAVLRLRPAA